MRLRALGGGGGIADTGAGRQDRSPFPTTPAPKKAGTYSEWPPRLAHPAPMHSLFLHVLLLLPRGSRLGLGNCPVCQWPSGTDRQGFAFHSGTLMQHAEASTRLPVGLMYRRLLPSNARHPATGNRRLCQVAVVMEKDVVTGTFAETF